jgi:O-Antigen ligase
MTTRAIGMGFQRGDQPSPTWIAAVAGTVLFGAAASVVLGPVALAIPIGIAVVVLLVRSPPLLLVTYGYIGVFKEGALLKSFPFDVTIALGLLLAAVCLWRLVEGRARPVPAAYLGLLLLIGVMLALSLDWTPMPAYGQEKVLKFFTLTALAALAPFFIIEDGRDVRALLWATVGLATLAAVLTLFQAGDPNSGRLEFGGDENTIFTSRLLCAGALVLLVAPAFGVPRRLRLAAPLLGAGLVFVALGVGSRGPVVALALALACVAAASVVKKPSQLVSVLVIVAAGIALFPLIQLPETSRQRLEQTVNNPVETLAEDGRSRLYNKAIELTAENPVRGFGAGGFFLYSYLLMNQQEKYPHNMFLELSAEVGLLPPIVLGVAIFYVLFTLGRRAWRAERDRDRRLTFVLGGLFLMNLFAVQFSGDINDNRVFWATFGLAWLVARYGIPDRNRGPWLTLNSSSETADR